MKLLKMSAGLLVVVCVFSSVALAQSTDPESLDQAITKLVDAWKIGGVGLILLALMQFVKHPMVMKFLAPLLAKAGVNIAKPVTAPESGIPMMPLTDVPREVIEQAKLEMKGSVVPYVTTGLGALAGVAESLATGRPIVQTVLEGLMSSGAGMGLYDLVIKPLVKKFSTK